MLIQKLYSKIVHHLCRTEISDTFIDEAEHINIAMSLYNLIGYSEITVILQEVYGSLKEMT